MEELQIAKLATCDFQLQLRDSAGLSPASPKLCESVPWHPGLGYHYTANYLVVNTTG